MSTQNICFHGEIRKLLCGYPLLSVAMFMEKILPVTINYYSAIYLYMLKATFLLKWEQ